MAVLSGRIQGTFRQREREDKGNIGMPSISTLVYLILPFYLLHILKTDPLDV
jgi:hypothetical protein